MSSSRSDSHSHSQSQYGRKRANTTLSMLSPILSAPPLTVGDSFPLSSWIHDPKECATVIFNYEEWCRGASEGDLLSVAASSGNAFLFTVCKNETAPKPQLQVSENVKVHTCRENTHLNQISIPKPIADTFDMKNYGDVTVTKVFMDVSSSTTIH